MAGRNSDRGRIMFEALREVVQAESSPETLGFALFASFDGKFEKAPLNVRAAMTAAAEEYESRRGSTNG
jgi:hypothetical protein